MKTVYLIFLFLGFFVIATAQESNDKNYNRRDFETLYDLFQNKNDLIKFLDIKPGETIADVGGDDGHHMGSLSLIYDDLTFYIEDVDSKLNAGDIEKMAKKFSKKRAGLQIFKNAINYFKKQLVQNFLDAELASLRQSSQAKTLY